MSDKTLDLTGEDRIEADLGGAWGFRDSSMGGEGFVSDGLSVGAAVGDGYVTLLNGYYSDDYPEMGVTAHLSPEQARLLGQALIDIADHVESKESVIPEDTEEKGVLKRLFG